MHGEENEPVLDLNKLNAACTHFQSAVRKKSTFRRFSNKYIVLTSVYSVITVLKQILKINPRLFPSNTPQTSPQHTTAFPDTCQNVSLLNSSVLDLDSDARLSCFALKLLLKGINGNVKWKC